jgi:hypothetical protein
LKGLKEGKKVRKDRRTGREGAAKEGEAFIQFRNSAGRDEDPIVRWIPNYFNQPKRS